METLDRLGRDPGGSFLVLISGAGTLKHPAEGAFLVWRLPLELGPAQQSCPGTDAERLCLVSTCAW